MAPLPDPAKFALCIAVGCAQIMESLLGFAATGNDRAIAAANMLALVVLAGYLLVVSRVFGACAAAANII
nr:unnamed protein product [Digitaria exilis]CAB3469889.1 unnamed protein product [Digitaria exilis]